MNEELFAKVIKAANKVHENTISYGNLIAISDELWERCFGNLTDCDKVIGSMIIKHKKYRSIDDLSEFDI